MAVNDWDNTVNAAAASWGVDPVLAKSVLATESSGQTTDKQGNPITSTAGARGLMQLMPKTAQGLGVQNIDDPTENIWGGVKYLSQLQAKYPNRPDLTVAAYNAGPGAVDNYIAGKAPLPDETNAYIPKVIKNYQQFKPATSPTQQAGDATTALADDTAAKQAFASKTGAALPGADDDAALQAFAAKTGAVMPGATAAPSSGSSAPDLPAWAGGGSGQAPATSATPTAAPAADPAVDPALAAFAKRTGAVLPGAVQPAAPVQQQAGVDDYGNPIYLDPTATRSPLGGGVIADIAKGATEGFGTGPLGVTGLTAAMQKAGIYPPAAGGGTALQSINQGVGNALAATGDLAARTAGAVFRGAQAGVADIPYVGRDLAAIPEAFAGDAGALHGGSPEGAVAEVSRPGVAEISQAAHDRLDAPLPADFQANPGVKQANSLTATSEPVKAGNALSSDSANIPTQYVYNNRRVTAVPAPSTTLPEGMKAGDTSAVPQAVLKGNGVGASIPDPTTAPGAANAVGAAPTPEALAKMTPGEIQAYRTQAETARLEEPQPAGRDNTQYVPGVTSTKAQIELTDNAAREEKQLKAENPGEYTEIQNQNNEARIDYLNDIKGTAPALQRMNDARAAQAQSDLAATWRNKTDADTQPIQDTYDAIKASEDWRRPVVQNAINSVMDALKEPDGSMTTDPQQIYGVRKHIDDLLSKEASRDNAVGDRAKANLLQMKNTLDSVIEPAAPGFGQYLKNFSENSKPIDAAEVLQSFSPLDSRNRMTLPKVNNMLKTIVGERKNGGISPYNSITDDQMAQLFNLRDDLRRTATADDLASTRGSDTHQNFMDAAKYLGKKGIETGAHVLIGHILPGAGNVAVHVLKGEMERSAETRRLRANAKKAHDNIHHNIPMRTAPGNEKITMTNPLSYQPSGNSLSSNQLA